MKHTRLLVGDRKVLLDHLRQLLCYVRVHFVVFVPSLFGGIDVEACTPNETKSTENEQKDNLKTDLAQCENMTVKPDTSCVWKCIELDSECILYGACTRNKVPVVILQSRIQ